MPLLEMILPRRDEINEHLVDAGSGVNIHAPANRLSQKEELGFSLCASALLLGNSNRKKKKNKKKEGCISSPSAQKYINWIY